MRRRTDGRVQLDPMNAAWLRAPRWQTALERDCLVEADAMWSTTAKVTNWLSVHKALFRYIHTYIPQDNKQNKFKETQLRLL